MFSLLEMSYLILAFEVCEDQKLLNFILLFTIS